ncbi:MAG: alpha/beta hydrolase [Pirellulales bacterium]|nr:alpha/beta hydrolase [Pirellulales bacterium]
MPNDFYVPTTISNQAQLAMAAFSLELRNFDLPEPDDLDGWRQANASFIEMFQPRNDKVVARYEPAIDQCELGGVPCLDIKPKDWQEDERVLIYTHGGGFAIFSAASTLTAAVPAAAATAQRVISIDYTVAPNAKWPEVTDQVISVFGALVDQGHPLEKIAIFGDSAGGSIAAGSVLKMRDQGRGMPAAVVLWSPWSDITSDGDTYKTLKDADPILYWPHNIEYCAATYATAEDQRHPYVSPVYGDYSSGFPPTLIQFGTKEIFVSDAVRHYRALDDAGVSVTLDAYEGMWHVFQAFSPEIPESKRARKKMAEFLARHMR